MSEIEQLQAKLKLASAALLHESEHSVDAATKHNCAKALLDINAPPPSIVCPICGLRSFNPTDIKEKYCVNCHKFHFDPLE